MSLAAACLSTKKVWAVIQPNRKTAIKKRNKTNQQKTVLLCISTSIHPYILFLYLLPRANRFWGLQFISHETKHCKLNWDVHHISTLKNKIILLTLVYEPEIGKQKNKKVEMTFGWSKVLHQATCSIPDCLMVGKSSELNIENISINQSLCSPSAIKPPLKLRAHCRLLHRHNVFLSLSWFEEPLYWAQTSVRSAILNVKQNKLKKKIFFSSIQWM